MPDRLTHTVRDHVREIVENHKSDPESIRESILVRDGFYCGRRFFADGLQVVWFVEENQLKVFDDTGSLILVTDAVPRDETPLRRAA